MIVHHDVTFHSMTTSSSRYGKLRLSRKAQQTLFTEGKDRRDDYRVTEFILLIGCQGHHLRNPMEVASDFSVPPAGNMQPG